MAGPVAPGAAVAAWKAAVTTAVSKPRITGVTHRAGVSAERPPPQIPPRRKARISSAGSRA